MTTDKLTQIEARAADWIAERDHSAESWPQERQQALDAWLKASTVHRVAFLRLDHAWRRADRLRALQASSAPLAAGQPQRARWAWLARPPVYRAAAGLCLTLLALELVTDFGGSRTMQTYATARGQRESVALADGSRLTLNTATQLRTAVTPQAREVWLDQGEAFFDIAHDAQRPFVIHAGQQTVTVLGTKFSLFLEGDSLRVAVLEGRVQVKTARSSPTVLARDEAAVADVSNVLVTKKSSQQLNAGLSWLQGKLVFDQVSLADAARQFNRYGRKQLVIEDDATARIAMGGVFDADNVEAFARLLHVGLGLNVRTVGNEIRVSSPAS
ncbi:FecR domain-containing protein [Janthinobacterium lividum]|nr:FecR domain-containing protein [Janthinobacterium lividum]